MVGISAELDSMQVGFADCDTVAGCCVDRVAVTEGLCDVGRVSGGGDTVGGLSLTVCVTLTWCQEEMTRWGVVWKRRRY